MSSHRHLQLEIKEKLDVAAGMVRRAEEAIMEMEFEYNERITALADGPGHDLRIAELTKEKEGRQEKLGLNEAYAAQEIAARRFALISRLYKIATEQKSPALLLEDLKDALSDNSSAFAATPNVDETVNRLAEALTAYLNYSLSDENDRKIRQVWSEIESLLSL
ncbi:MAG: hypothetical protein V3R66_04475 [Rhodospirillales bacterium]